MFDKLCLAFVLIQTIGLVVGDTCSYSTITGTSYLYCEDYCCGSYDDRYCCSYYWSTGGIAGLSLGLTATVAIIVAVIIICRRRRRMRLYYQQQPVGPGVTVVSSQMHAGMTSPAQVPPPYPGPPSQQQYPYPGQQPMPKY